MIIALNLVISRYYRLDTPQFASYRLEPGDIDIIIALTHAAIFDYRLGHIDIIIALTHAAIYDYRLNLVISILLSP
jgi:hypothetical protein